ncbi:DUF6221 family protein (plasmid) [Arthrobacter agilis]|uniref:DUF6221 family protein n=1 Tax=Arthrobacter agilis TaxID=37921 RepID=UPI0023655C96|nr:DUF6221 family protein [Arthrobacter agilis]WDF35063.1 DUF6221 family protein [Arthrobacter agilis]
MDELAALILTRVEEDHDLAYHALHDPGAGGILGAHTRNCHAADTGRTVDVAGHELLLDPLVYHNLNQSTEKVIADCVAKQRLVAHVQSIDWDYEPAGEQDYMRTILELPAVPWRDHPDYAPHWGA